LELIIALLLGLNLFRLLTSRFRLFSALSLNSLRHNFLHLGMKIPITSRKGNTCAPGLAGENFATTGNPAAVILLNGRGDLRRQRATPERVPTLQHSIPLTPSSI